MAKKVLANVFTKLFLFIVYLTNTVDISRSISYYFDYGRALGGTRLVLLSTIDYVCSFNEKLYSFRLFSLYYDDYDKNSFRRIYR